jgi:hypothetical protein
MFHLLLALIYPTILQEVAKTLRAAVPLTQCMGDGRSTIQKCSSI